MASNGAKITQTILSILGTLSLSRGKNLLKKKNLPKK